MPVGKAIEPFYVELGRRIQRARIRNGLSQQALGAAVSPPVTRASIANIEGGKQRVLAHTACQLAAVLSVPLGELLEAPKYDAAGESVISVVEQELGRKLPLSKKKIKGLVSRMGILGRRSG